MTWEDYIKTLANTERARELGLPIKALKLDEDEPESNIKRDIRLNIIQRPVPPLNCQIRPRRR